MGSSSDAGFDENKWFGKFIVDQGFKNHKVSSRKKLEYLRN